MIAAHRHRRGLMFPKSAAFRLEPQILGNNGILDLETQRQDSQSHLAEPDIPAELPFELCLNCTAVSIDVY